MKELIGKGHDNTDNILFCHAYHDVDFNKDLDALTCTPMDFFWYNVEKYFIYVCT